MIIDQFYMITSYIFRLDKRSRITPWLITLFMVFCCGLIALSSLIPCGVNPQGIRSSILSAYFIRFSLPQSTKLLSREAPCFSYKKVFLVITLRSRTPILLTSDQTSLKSPLYLIKALCFISSAVVLLSIIFKTLELLL